MPRTESGSWQACAELSARLSANKPAHSMKIRLISSLVLLLRPNDLAILLRRTYARKRVALTSPLLRRE